MIYIINCPSYRFNYVKIQEVIISKGYLQLVYNLVLLLSIYHIYSYNIMVCL